MRKIIIHNLRSRLRGYPDRINSGSYVIVYTDEATIDPKEMFGNLRKLSPDENIDFSDGFGVNKIPDPAYSYALYNSINYKIELEPILEKLECSESDIVNTPAYESMPLKPVYLRDTSDEKLRFSEIICFPIMLAVLGIINLIDYIKDKLK